jgi:hypothetical protein
MPDDAMHFRERARDCRNLAKGARNQVDAAMLEDIAGELEHEARRIELDSASTLEDGRALKS